MWHLWVFWGREERERVIMWLSKCRRKRIKLSWLDFSNRLFVSDLTIHLNMLYEWVSNGGIWGVRFPKHTWKQNPFAKVLGKNSVLLHQHHENSSVRLLLHDLLSGLALGSLSPWVRSAPPVVVCHLHHWVSMLDRVFERKFYSGGVGG